MLPDDTLLSFGSFELDLTRGTLSRGGVELPLRPKCFEVLTFLARNPGRLVTKDELLAAAWSGLIVTDSSLPQCLMEIRRVLGAEARALIHTVPRRGYRFEAVVRQRGPALAASAIAKVRRPAATKWWSATLGLAVLISGLGIVPYGWLSTGGDPAAATPAHSSESGQPGRLQTSSAAGRDYLQGKYFENRRAPGDAARAIDYYRRATELDPGMADAWIGLATASHLIWMEQPPAAREPLGPDHLALLQRALSIDPHNPDAHIRAAGYYRSAGDEENTQRHLDLAVQYGSDSPLVQSIAAAIAFWRHDLRRAVELATRAVELEPLSFSNQENLGAYHFFAGNPALALQHFEIARDISPEHAGKEGDFVLVQAMILLQDLEAAERLAYQLPDGPARDQGLALVYGARGQSEPRDQYIERLVRSPSADAALRLAEIHGFLGNHDLSQQWMSSAVERKESELLSADLCCDADFASSALFSPFLAQSHRQLDPTQRDRLLATLDILVAGCSPA